MESETPTQTPTQKPESKTYIVALIIIIVLLAIGYMFFVASPQEDKNDTLPSQAPPTTPSEPSVDSAPPELLTEVLIEGEGEGAKEGDALLVHYTGTLPDGTVFDSSLQRGEPFSLILGAGQVIQGWDMGLVGMKVGEKRLLTIPSMRKSLYWVFCFSGRMRGGEAA